MAQKELSGSEFLDIITSSDTTNINKVSNEIIRRLELYLVSVYDTEPQLAKDCAQTAFEKVYVKIVDKELSDVDDVYGYFIRSCRNEYLMARRRDRFEVPIDQSYIDESRSSPVNYTLQDIAAEDRETLLQHCIESLQGSRKKFFKFVLEHINEKDADAAKKLKISHSNYRTKKSRIINALKDCVNKAKNNM